MSLGVVVKAPEGLVLAAESRVTLTATPPGGTPIYVNFDNATKLLSFSEPNIGVGAVTYGQAAIGLRTAQSFIPEFEASLPPDALKVGEFAAKLSGFFVDQWKAVMPSPYQGPEMTFVVGGFDEGEPYGRVFVLDIPTNPSPREMNQGAEFGITWGGQREIVDRLIRGFDSGAFAAMSQALGLDPTQVALATQALEPFQLPVPLAAMPLQDCVDLAIFFIRTTIDGQALTAGLRGCGGPIDVATITRREGLVFVQRKRIVGELGLLTEELRSATI